jgi:NAD(P)H-dependent flavin oxidoreductase YrpB (nitropropane dioxygenase family)
MAPKDLESQPIIGTMKLAGETISLRRFTSFVPTPDTEGKIDEMPFLAGQGVGLIHDVIPVGQIIESMVDEAAKALSSLRR